MGKSLDTIFRRIILKSPKKILKKPLKEKKKTVWLIFLVAIFLFFGVSFFFFGKIAAQLVIDSIKPISLFKDGKYLVLLQNNAELRSSGGFIGSYAVVTFDNYEIKDINFNTNILALDRSFEENNYVEAPTPLRNFLKNKTWSLRDSNYDASFVDAAIDINKFYELETNEKVDGIVATNASLIVNLLKITGPIKMDKYNLTIDENNFYDVTQYQVEKGYFENQENWVINEPKTFLKDLYPEIMNQATNHKKSLIDLLNTEIKNNEIMFYFKDSQKQAIAVNEGWAGQVENSDSDYLYINSNSYSGDKSSIKIDESIDYKVRVNSLGQLIGTLKITKIHTGSFVWPDGANNTWTRIYVPEGSIFTKSIINGKIILESEKTIANEYGKTYFGYKIFTNPSEVTVFELEYLLPIGKENYHLLIQKQPGINSQVTATYLNKLLYSGQLISDLNLESF